VDRVRLSHQEIFERYLYAGAVTRDPDAFAALFSVDGVYEMPLLPDGHRLPRRLAGREAIREGIVAVQALPGPAGTLDPAASRHVLHDTGDPGTFIAEIDTVFDGAGGRRTTMSLVWIFRVRDGEITSLRDYFAPPA
jgi:ketosteroid isomerase-like protein